MLYWKVYKPMSLNILPYTQQDGIRTVRDSGIKSLFDRTEREGLLPVVFYGGGVKSADEFLKKMQNSILWILRDGDKHIGYVWLDHFEGKYIK